MSKKKSKVKCLRNVLASPFCLNWSENNPEEVASLQEALRQLLPLAKLEKTTLKMASKDKSKETTIPKIPLKEKQTNVFRTYLAPGFQSVIRGVEKRELCCVVLSSDISPPMIQRVMCSYCNTYDIPLVIVPQLKTIAKAALGFPAMVLGLKKIVKSPENQFHKIYEKVLQNRCVFETPFTTNDKGLATEEEDCKSHLKTVKSSTSHVTKTNNFYLFRERKHERVFRPGSGMNKTASVSQHGMDADFISLGKSESKYGTKMKGLISNTSNTHIKSGSEDDSDSLDGESIFFIDNKPDHMLLDVEPSNNEENGSQSKGEINRFNTGLSTKIDENTAKKKVKKPNERYFLNDTQPNIVRNKDEIKYNKKSKGFKKSNGIDKFTSFKPLTVKTIISNPKKVRRKKSNKTAD